MRSLALILPSLLSLSAHAKDSIPTNDKSGIRVEWGVAAAFDINIPGDWRSTDTSTEVNLGFGGQAGGVVNLCWKQGWRFEAGLTAGYDRLEFSYLPEVKERISLDRWSLNVPVTTRYMFEATEEMRIGPVAGFNFSYFFSDDVSANYDIKDSVESNIWNRSNAAWGFGAGLQFDRYAVDITGWFGMVDMIKKNHFNLSSPCYPNVVRISVKYFL
ncbi:MAG: PorT family protein [Muribaculaceae bacterium]|nr:PorT family protein [Muribaculaceae bacterium]